MSWVVAKPGESFESLVRRFKKAVEKSGLLADVRKHEFFEKPSVLAKKKSAAARKRAAKRFKKSESFGKKSNQNFRFNKDHTQKIPLVPQKKKPEYKKKFTNTPTNNSQNQGQGYQNRRWSNDRPQNNQRPPMKPKRQPTENKG